MNLQQKLAFKLYRTVDPGCAQIKLTERSIHDRYHSGLAALPQYLDGKPHVLKGQTVEEIIGNAPPNESCSELAALFTRYGSDKSTTHNYHLIYEFLLRGKRQEPMTILEVGMGSDDPTIPSNMGVDGKPGASLRAFKEWAPRAAIKGADVDKKILFQEDRIETFFIDQTDIGVLREAKQRFAPKTFDLMIDDGLHLQGANLNFLVFALDLVKDDGTIVIEDVDEDDRLFWCVVSQVFKIPYLYFVKTKHSSVVIVRTKEPLPKPNAA
jgi:hypothetical protein